MSKKIRKHRWAQIHILKKYFFLKHLIFNYKKDIIYNKGN